MHSIRKNIKKHLYFNPQGVAKVMGQTKTGDRAARFQSI